MKTTIPRSIGVLFTLLVVWSSSGQVRQPEALDQAVFDGVNELGRTLVSAPLDTGGANADIAIARAGFCLTNSQQDVWNDAAWNPFSRYVSSCDNNGKSVDQASEIHVSTDWTKTYRWLRTYNGAGDLTEWIHQLSPNDEYVNSSRDAFTFNGAGNRTESLDQDWDGSQWVNIKRTTTTYNGDGFADSAIDQEWDGSQWVNVERDTATDTGNNTYTYLTEKWDGAAWQPKTRQLFVSIDNQNFHFTIQVWDGTQWVDDSRYTSAPPENTVETWNGSSWIGQQKQIEVRDASKRRTELREQTWVASAWEDSYRVRYIFDATSGLQTEFILEDWDGSAWIADTRVGYTYDGDDNRIEDLWQDWDGSAWENLQRYTLLWQPVGGVGVENEPSAANGIRMYQSYPNPAESNATIRFELDRSTEVRIVLIDVLGRERSILVSDSMPTGTHEIVVDVRDMAAGTYFYRLSSGNTVLVSSLIVNR